MKVLTLYKPTHRNPITPEHMAAMEKFIDELRASGVLLATEGRKDRATEMRIKLSKGELTVTDGPFTESKELIAGFALLRVKSREELIELSRRFLEIAGDGESEVIEVFSE
jgi:hypothetical protein